MALCKPARFDKVSFWRQLVQEYETAALGSACFCGAVVPPGCTEASIVDAAWDAADARYKTLPEVKEYAKQVLHEAERFHDALNGPSILLCVLDARNAGKHVFCRIGIHDKLKVAIKVYMEMWQSPIKEIQYSGVPHADQRVYPWNTPGGLAMNEHDVITVFHEVVPQDNVVNRILGKCCDIRIVGGEGLVETYLLYTYFTHEPFDKYAKNFCMHKGLDASKVRFMHGGHMIPHDEGKKIHESAHIVAPEYIPKPGPLLIYVVPKPEFEADPDECYEPGACLDDEGAVGAAAGGTRVRRQRRPVVKMDL